MKKVLIIGGAGYIGGYTTDYLLQKGYDVCVFDSLLYETRYLKKVNFIYGDIRDTELVIKTAIDYDCIIIMAAFVGDPVCAGHPDLADEINHIAVKNICHGLTNQHVIFLSTCSVYGKNDNMLDEFSPVNPLSVYAKTKFKAENYIYEKNGTIFRLGTVYGIGDSFSRIRLDLVVNVLAMRSFYEKEITIYGGEQWRPLISVKDIAGYINEAIDRGIRGTYILSNENCRMKELASRIALPDTTINYTESKPDDARNYKVSQFNSQLKFIYHPVYTIEDEVKELFALFKERRIKNVYSSDYHNGEYLKNLSK